MKSLNKKYIKILSTLSVLALISIGINADTGLNIFNTKKNEVESNQAPRITSSNGATSSVGTGTHWEETVKRELSNYDPDTSDIEAKLRSEFTAADNTLRTSISQTNTNVSSLESTTNTKINNLDSTTNTKINNLKTATNNSLATLDTSVKNLDSDMATANSQIAELFERVAALELLHANDGSPGGSGWQIIYSGSGTTTVNLPSGWSEYRASYALKTFTTEGGYKDISVVDNISSYGSKLGAEVTSNLMTQCTLTSNTGPVSTFVYNKETVQQGTISWDADLSSTVAHPTCPGNARADIIGFKITKFEIK